MNKLYLATDNNSILVYTLVGEDTPEFRESLSAGGEIIDPKLIEGLPTEDVDAWVYNRETKKVKVDKEKLKEVMLVPIRVQRDKLLAESDILLVRAFEQEEDVEPLKVYRQTLRDIPLQKDLSNIEWPILP